MTGLGYVPARSRETSAVPSRPGAEPDCGWFVFAAAHDLQSPLTVVQSSLQMLLSGHTGRLGEEEIRLVARADHAVSRMTCLIRDLLAYAKAGSRPEAPRERIDLNRPLRAALVDLAAAIEETGATITHEPLPEVWGFPGLLTQLFQNLIGNAIKFRGNEPLRVTVRAAQERGEWLISVIDNGQGFDPAYAERIFAPFRRLHGSSVPGHGLGLAFCRRIVDDHGGRLWAHSEPGKGSTFCFTLPAEEARPEPIRADGEVRTNE